VTEITAQIARRTKQLGDALAALDSKALNAPSRLPGWSRLTIACHLRYGAEAVNRMVGDTVAGRATSYYPEGRSQQRPGTLLPGPSETGAQVIAALRAKGTELDRAWADLSSGDWERPIQETAPDLGPVSLAFLALLRLSEVEVHGLDLDVGVDEWSDLFVRTALPARLEWLPARARLPETDSSWLLTPTDGPSFLVTATVAGVQSEPAPAGARAEYLISGTSRDLLAMLLGRDTHDDLGPGAMSFQAAFPGP
jgi:uncharacterized protein (TIGR03083 family)